MFALLDDAKEAVLYYNSYTDGLPLIELKLVLNKYSMLFDGDDKDSISTGLFFENPETLFVILNAQCILSEICSSKYSMLFDGYNLELYENGKYIDGYDARLTNNGALVKDIFSVSNLYLITSITYLG